LYIRTFFAYSPGLDCVGGIVGGGGGLVGWVGMGPAIEKGVLILIYILT